jgi:uncharacterized C2H2 Zn-finger protein
VDRIESQVGYAPDSPLGTIEMEERDNDGLILVRCPVCGRLFQPDSPLRDDFSQYVTKAALAGECPNHSLLSEVIED